MDMRVDNARYLDSKKRLFFENDLNAYDYGGEKLKNELSSEEYIEKIVLESYPDLARYESDGWALPMRCFHKDVDYNTVFEDSLATMKKSEAKHDLLMDDFSSFNYSYHMKRPRSLSVPSGTTSMETDESSYSEENVHEQIIIDAPTDFDGESLF
jgi:hypothetical protein